AGVVPIDVREAARRIVERRGTRALLEMREAAVPDVANVAREPLAVAVLIFGQPQRTIHGHVGAGRDVEASRATTILRGDDDRAVRGACTVERRRVRALEHRD